MNSMDAQQVMSGTEGELWIDGAYMAQVTAFKAVVTLIKQEVNQVKRRGKKYKTTGWEGKGSIKMNHVSSFMIEKLAENIKNGHQTVCVIVAKLSDPDAIGSERVTIRDATFDSLTLMDWEAKKLVDDKYDFTFTDFETPETASE